MQDNHRPIRVLHVVGGMNRGGIETWLMHVLRHHDCDRFQMDFVFHVSEPCAYDDELRELGSTILVCPYHRHPLQYAQRFKQILRDYKPDVVHSHVSHFSGYVLYLAHQEHVPVRIAHSHNDSSVEEAKASWQRRAYITLMKQWISQNATLGLGCSRRAIASLFGKNWESDPRWQLLYYGIDLTPFKHRVNSTHLRQVLGIPQDAFVIGHVGRFIEQKNHTFWVEIAAEIARREPNTHFLLVGEGALRSPIEQQIEELGLTARTTFAGSRSDIPELMQGVIDVLLFPSLHEGLPLVLLEAQAAGLHSVISDTIDADIEQNQLLIHWMSLSQSPSSWADVVLGCRAEAEAIAPSRALDPSPFNIEIAVKRLQALYQTQLSNPSLSVV